MFGPFPQMENEDLEEDQIDGGYDVPENMTLEQYVQIWALHIQKNWNFGESRSEKRSGTSRNEGRGIPRAIPNLKYSWWNM